jgi:hypothetical protein
MLLWLRHLSCASVGDDARDSVLSALTGLLDRGHLSAPDLVPDVVLDAGRQLGWTVVVYVIDYEQRVLTPLLPTSWDDRETEDVDATVAGRCFRNTATVAVGDDRPRVWAPLIDGVDRLGVLSIEMPRGNDPEDDETRDQIRWFSHLCGHLVSAKAAYGDALHRARLTRQRTVESELIWSLLPPLTGACEGLLISGVLEPAHVVAGDVFDYSIVDGLAHVAIFDATGHDLKSSLIGALAISSYRNERRKRQGLGATASEVDRVLAEFEMDTLATGVLGQIDITTGLFRYVNAGHPSPLLVRQGRVVKELDGGRRILFGIGGRTAQPAEEQLEAGDWIVLYTDGVIEARDPNRAFFGLERFVDLLERSAANGQPPPETLRRVTHAVLDHQQGVLQDDATILMVEWSGGGEHELTVN